MSEIKVLETEDFRKQFKKLEKYKSLKEDFEMLKEVISKIPKGNGTKH